MPITEIVPAVINVLPRGLRGAAGADGAPGDQLNFATDIAAAAATIVSTVQFLRTAGATAIGDGGAALFKRVMSLSGSSFGFQSADGAWQYAEYRDSFPSTVAATAATIISAVQFVRTAGYSAAGDGAGALFKRMSALDPSAFGFQSADGALRQYAESEMNVRAFGAKGDGGAENQPATTGTDDTAAIQAAIDMSAPGHLIGLVTRRFPIVIPPGIYKISELNATNIDGFTMRGLGSGALRSLLRNYPPVNAILDMAGSCTGFNLRDFLIYGPLSDGLSASYPAIGLLLAVTSAGNGNYCEMENVNSNGRFRVAARYVYGVCCSETSTCNAVNVNQNDPNAYCAVYTSSNSLGLESSFTETATTSNTGVSDWLHERCEHHAFTSASGQSKAILLEGTTNMTWINGNIAAAGQGYIVELKGGNPHATFTGVTFYTDQGRDRSMRSEA
jgi:hypothetical protein